MTKQSAITRRKMLAVSATVGVSAVTGFPAIVKAEPATLKTTGFGGPWRDVMTAELIPDFEKEHNCRVQFDFAYGSWIAKLQSSPRSNPVYDVFHANGNEQWVAVTRGLVEQELDASKIPNLADVYTYAKSSDVVGVDGFIMGIGLGYRKDLNAPAPSSWKDYWAERYSGTRGGYTIPTHAFGQEIVMLSGMLYGSGQKDLDAAYKALERLKPIKLTNFGTAMMKMLMSGEISICPINDGNVFRYSNETIDYVVPSEGALINEQAYSITTGTKLRELSNAYINFILSPRVQKRIGEELWIGPVNRKVKVDPKFVGKMLTTEQEIDRLIKVDWKWYNAQKPKIDAQVNRIFGT